MTLLYFIIAISVLVVIHEYGHFWVARRCGVKVLRFSVGFGNPLFSWKDKHDTEFAIAPIPLGGYVKMLDEREGPVPEHLLDQAFTQKTAWQRIAIAAAGPIANFLFAIIAYWILFVAGTTGVVPVVGEVKDSTPAAVAGLRSGDEIIAIDGEETTSWQEVSWQLVNFIGEDASFPVVVESESGAQRRVDISVSAWLSDSEAPDPIDGLGIEPRRMDIPAQIGQLSEDGRALASGLKTGDIILEVDLTPISDWYQWVEIVQAAPEQTLALLIERDDQTQVLSLTPARKELDDGEVIGFVGAGVQVPEIPADWLRTSQAGFLQALSLGVEKTWNLIGFTLESLWKMIRGDVSVKNLSGPITIAKVAGSSASGGLESFIGFLALLSVSLGVLNLLPVPMLDGGHILFYSAEMLTGKPLPEKVQIAAIKVGMFLLFSLMAVAFYNDISRL
ncbi:RIP metalloprotease RseP [Bacterioplanoides sp. SCSIO 12839]|uniref:RIP metalloprotease RseP n=1 Tax=Bacterioplanoides sp. SCSIO 12839 TaxID=2829569 RepID=UPI0021021D59|nr:RIP metalloprotease RseP [Bacterioplanoides sp. SCSIO 12839]UTW49063.1 RIP metalloprotease RseP [Bacterioplanoides sp. SCSIO 12839]